MGLLWHWRPSNSFTVRQRTQNTATIYHKAGFYPTANGGHNHHLVFFSRSGVPRPPLRRRNDIAASAPATRSTETPFVKDEQGQALYFQRNLHLYDVKNEVFSWSLWRNSPEKKSSQHPTPVLSLSSPRTTGRYTHWQTKDTPNAQCL